MLSVPRVQEGGGTAGRAMRCVVGRERAWFVVLTGHVQLIA